MYTPILCSTTTLDQLCVAQVDVKLLFLDIVLVADNALTEFFSTLFLSFNIRRNSKRGLIVELREGLFPARSMELERKYKGRSIYVVSVIGKTEPIFDICFLA